MKYYSSFLDREISSEFLGKLVVLKLGPLFSTQRTIALVTLIKFHHILEGKITLILISTL